MKYLAGIAVILVFLSPVFLRSEKIVEPVAPPEEIKKTNSFTATPFNDLVEQALFNLKGTKYVWGGESLAGADCSGAMHYIFKYAGKPFPRMTSRKMYTVFGTKPTIHWSDVGKYEFLWWTFSPDRPYGHVGLAEGDGWHFWQAGVHSGFSEQVFREGGYWDEPYSGYGSR